MLAVLLTAGFLFAIKWQERTAEVDGGGSVGSCRAFGLAAAGLFLVFSTTWHDYDALAANCELFLLAPQAAAAWLLLRELRARSAGVRGVAIHLAVGALIGTSALFKYQGLTFLGASIGLLLWWVILGRASGSLGRDDGACSAGRRAGAARALSAVVPQRRQPGGRRLLVQVQLLVRGGGADRLRGDGARTAPDGADRRRGAGSLRAGHRGGDLHRARRSFA